MNAVLDHRRIDRRSIALHTAIAEKLRRDPSLLSIAFENLDRWSQTAVHSRPYLDGWRELLHRPLDELLSLLMDESEGMTAMRQNSPFAGVLTPQERWAIYDEFAPPRTGSK
jgi:hypothetical protein